MSRKVVQEFIALIMGGSGPGSCGSGGSGGKELELLSLQSLLGIELQYFKVGIKRSSDSSAGFRPEKK